MKRQALIAAAALTAALAIAQPASAQRYSSYHDEHVATQQQCSTSRQNRMIGGAIIGGIAGALLGREVADRGVRGEGAALGAAVGAAAGAGVGRATANCSNQVQGQYDPYYGRPVAEGYGDHPRRPYDDGYNQAYRGDDSGLYGGPYEESNYRRDDDCRPGEVITHDRRGREHREQVMMCRDDYGQWRPQY